LGASHGDLQSIARPVTNSPSTAIGLAEARFFLRRIGGDELVMVRGFSKSLFVFRRIPIHDDSWDWSWVFDISRSKEEFLISEFPLLYMEIDKHTAHAMKKNFRYGEFDGED
jgi:hypothetical protein